MHAWTILQNSITNQFLKWKYCENYQIQNVYLKFHGKVCETNGLKDFNSLLSLLDYLDLYEPFFNGSKDKEL